MKNGYRALALPFVVTLSTAALPSACESQVSGGPGEPDDGAGAGPGEGGGGSGTGVGTGTVSDTGTSTGTGTGGCIYHPSPSCNGVADGVPCDDEGAFCGVQVMCADFPNLTTFYALCSGGAWNVHRNPYFVPACNTGTATSNPPSPCPCDEPEEGTSCGGGPWGVDDPCTYKKCEQVVCDPELGTWVKESTCP
jgi:hypothetical protein